MTFTPRFPNAPQNYDAQNEAQFRTMVRQQFADATAPAIGLVEAVLDDGDNGDTLIWVTANGDWTPQTNFIVDMQFEQGFTFYDAVQTLANINEVKQLSPAISGGGSGTPGEVTTAGSVKTSFHDFSDLSVGAGVPTGFTAIDGPSLAPTWAVGNDATEGNYLEADPAGSSEGWAAVYDGWDGQLGLTDSWESLARIYVQTTATNRRWGGLCAHIGGTSHTDLDFSGPGIYFRNALDWESNWLEVVNTSGSIYATGDMQEAETSGVWLWIRGRVVYEGTGAGKDDFYVKAWTGSLDDEPASWDGSTTNTHTRSGSLGTGIGWAVGAQVAYGTQIHRIAFQSWTNDPGTTDPPESGAASSVAHVILRNTVDAITEFRVQTKNGTLGSTDAEARFALHRQTDDSNFEQLRLYNKEESAAIEMGLRQYKAGTGSYGPFYFGWGTTDGITILSPDDGGGPLITFNVATAFDGNGAFADDAQVLFGTGSDYWFEYDSTNTAFELWSTNVDGGGTDGRIFDVQDGTDVIRFYDDITFSGAGTSDIGDGTNYAGAVYANTYRAESYFEVNSATPASAGAIRLPNNTGLEWRNNANTLNLGLVMGTDDVLVPDMDIRIKDTIQLFFGTGDDYWFDYSGGTFYLSSTNVDGGGTDGDIFRVTDGSDDIYFLGGVRIDGVIRNDQGIALGGGASATLGTIGGSGPATAAQNQWLQIDIGGTSYWLPVWA